MHKFIIICLFLSLTLFLDSNFSLANDLPSQEAFIEKGIVTKILSEKHDKDLEKLFNTEQIIQILNIKILTGKLKNKEVKIKNYLTSNPEYDIKIKQGDRVIIERDIEAEDDDEYYNSPKNGGNSEDGSDETINITAKDNSPIILAASGLFLLLLLAIGGTKGLKTIAVLGFAGFLIKFILIPAILTDTAVISTIISIALASTIFGVFILNGLNIKSACALIGASLSFILAGLLSAAVIYLAAINNIDTKEGMILMNEYPDLNFGEILTASVVISVLGALISTGIAIANYIGQSLNTDYDFKNLFKKGIFAGKEATGTVISTLLFAYMGGALPLLLLSFSIPFIKFINLGIVLTWFSIIITGGIAIILCSPITSAVTAYIMPKFVRPENSPNPNSD